MNKKQERLIEITADDIIDNDELDDFIYIQEELEKISVNVETLQLWSERMLASGAIDEASSPSNSSVLYKKPTFRTSSANQ